MFMHVEGIDALIVRELGDSWSIGLEARGSSHIPPRWAREAQTHLGVEDLASRFSLL